MYVLTTLARVHIYLHLFYSWTSIIMLLLLVGIINLRLYFQIMNQIKEHQLWRHEHNTQIRLNSSEF